MQELFPHHIKKRDSYRFNKIKSCRVSLKEYGLIDYNWQTNSTTMYHILDKINNPESFTKKDAIKKDNKMKEEILSLIMLIMSFYQQCRFI